MSQENVSPGHNRIAMSNEPRLLTGQWLIAARAVWLLITLVGVSLFVTGVPLHFQNLITPCLGDGCIRGQLAPETVPLLETVGLTLTTYARIIAGSSILMALVYSAVGILIYWRRSHEWMALISSLWLITFGLTAYEGEVRAVGVNYPWLQPVVLSLIYLSGVVLLSLFFFIFPNGRFINRSTRWLWLIIIFIFLIFSNVEYLEGQFFANLATSLWGVMILTGIGVQIYRYRRVSRRAERRQTKWVMFALLIMFAGIVTLFLLAASGPFNAHPGLNSALTNVVESTIGTFAFLAIPLGIGISILRYGLYDIDVIIRRTLQYSLLTSTLAAVYFGSVVVVQAIVNSISGRSQLNQITIVLSTLLIAALFNPLRRRIQSFIDRRFYRRKYDAQQVLARFSTTMRDEVDLERLSAVLLGVVEETMQPQQVNLWLKQTHNSIHHNRITGID